MKAKTSHHLQVSQTLQSLRLPRHTVSESALATPPGLSPQNDLLRSGQNGRPVPQRRQYRPEDYSDRSPDVDRQLGHSRRLFQDALHRNGGRHARDEHGVPNGEGQRRRPESGRRKKPAVEPKSLGAAAKSPTRRRRRKKSGSRSPTKVSRILSSQTYPLDTGFHTQEWQCA